MQFVLNYSSQIRILVRTFSCYYNVEMSVLWVSCFLVETMKHWNWTVQVSVLGPLLFILYCTSALSAIGIASSHDIEIHLYADDTQLYVWTPA